MDTIEVFPNPPPPASLVIPSDVESVLPGRSLTVAELLQYVFPNPFTTPRDGARTPAWLDLPPHNVNARLLLSCTVPRWETVKHLLSDVRHLASTPQSLSRAAVLPDRTLPDRLPIWVLTFWDRLSEAHDTYLSWRRCRDWAHRLCVESDQPLLAELDTLLQVRVRWHGYLAGERRDRHVTDIFNLLSNNELNSGQINDLLELIERRLPDTLESQAMRYLVAPSELSALILYSYEYHLGPTYRKQPIQRLVEEQLIQRHRSAVASIAWVSVCGRGHWVAYIVNPITSTIFYGDSLGQHIPADLRDALQWWLCGLRERMGEPACPPTFEPILITGQEDGFSCGILSTNSLLHHLLPNKFPLVLRDSISIKTYRIERTVEILKMSVELVHTFLDRFVRALTLRTFQSENHVREFAPIIPPSWPPPCPSSPRSSPIPSRPSSPLQLPPTPSPPPPSSPPFIHTISKHKRTEDGAVRGQPRSKQQKINQFFTKLTPEEGMEQAASNLARSVDAREEWIEKEEARESMRKVSHRVANTQSQQRCRVRKKEEEIWSGARGPDGKIKKVIKSVDFHAIANLNFRNAHLW
jgi:hypothetical protein